MRTLFFSLFSLLVINSQSQIITTIGGTGTWGYSGDGGPATSAILGDLYYTYPAIDKAGNIYIAQNTNNTIRKIDANGVITTIAGKLGVWGYSGDGGLATNALLYHPTAIVVDNNGNIIFADANGNYIRKIDPSGIITTISGTYITGCGVGDGGPISGGRFEAMSAIVLDKAGNMYISDYGCNTVRKVNTYGILSTIAGNGTHGFSGDGGPATSAQLGYPCKVAVDSHGNLYIPDAHNHRIRKVDKAGIITTIAGTGVIGYTGDGGPATAATLYLPGAVVIDKADNLYVSDQYGTVIRKIDPSGIITTFAGTGVGGYSGDGGPAINAKILTTEGRISIDDNDNIYFADESNSVIRKISNCLTAAFSSQPLDVTLCNSGDATFSTSVANYTSLQWQVNSGNGWNDVNDNSIYSGTNSTSLKVTGATTAMNNYQYRCLAQNSCGSLSTQNVALKVNSRQQPSISVNATNSIICEGTNVSFSASYLNGGSSPTIQWQKNGVTVGSNNISYSDNNLKNDDVISCILSSNESCIASQTANSNAIMMTVRPKLTPTITIASSNNNICFGTPVTFSSSITNGGTTPSYHWTKNGIAVSNESFYTDNSLKNSDLVQCTLTSNDGCLTTPSAASNQVTVNVTPQVTPAVSVTSDVAAICPGASVSFSANAVNGGTSPSYQWMKNGVSVGFDSPNYLDNSIANGDAISCKIISNATCLANSSAISTPTAIKVYQKPLVSLDHSTTLCTGSSRQLDAGNFTSYLWSNGSTNRYLSVNGTGTYFVTVIDNNGCKASDTTVVTSMLTQPSNFLSADTSICSYGSLTITPDQKFNSYLWSNGASVSNITVTAPGTYWLQVRDANQCTGKDSIMVSPKECMKGLYVPTAFTPNGDGKNDVFRPLLFGNVKQLTFTVYNRWGQIVFQTHELQKGWNGQVAGIDQQSNVFVWICSYQLENEQPRVQKGTVMLIR